MTETYTVFIHGNTREECRTQARVQLHPLLGFNPFDDAEATARGVSVDLWLDVSAITTVGGQVLGWQGDATATLRERWI